MPGRRLSEAAPIPLVPVPASGSARAALGQPGVATAVVCGAPTRRTSPPPPATRPAPDDPITAVEQEVTAWRDRGWRVWFGPHWSMRIGADLVVARVAERAPDSPCDGLHAQRCQAARAIALELLAGDAPLQAGERAAKHAPSTGTFARLYNQDRTESARRGGLASRDAKVRS